MLVYICTNNDTHNSIAGGIICSDEEQVSIEAIEHQICCEELKDVIKVVIIQACQGEVEGEKNFNFVLM